MFKKKPKYKCSECNAKVEKKYSFCPNCGADLIDRDKEKEDFGYLGREDNINEEESPMQSGFGITDKLMNSLVNSLVKSIDKQFKDINREMTENEDRPEVRSFPNGIRIRVGQPQNNPKQKKKDNNIMKKNPDVNQLKKMSELPREKAKSNIKRLNDSIVYELSTPGVYSIQDIFVAKIEEGYEIKAIGTKKIYVSSLPLNLPLKKLSLLKNKLLIEFKTEE